MRLNLGCGTVVPDGWINVDYALGARIAKVPLFRPLNKKLGLFEQDWDDRICLHDLTKTFPWGDGTVDAVYASHTLEHFSKEEGRRLLAECHRVLRVHGIIRIVVPDLRYYVNNYVEGRVRADDFIESLGVLYGKSDNAIKNRLYPFIQFPHRCMYDEKRLIELLGEIGFDATGRAPFDSDISDIRGIEWDWRTENAVIVEGRKRSS